MESRFVGDVAPPQGGATPTVPVVTLRGISKRFGGHQAVIDVDAEIRAGTVHAFVGENGAGKSTLGKIIAGVHQADDGTMLLDGEPVRYRNPAAALNDGITVIAQEITLAEDLTIAENVFLGNEPGGFMRSGRRLHAEFEELSARTGLRLPPDVPVRELRLAEKQEVEILRALARRARVIVMDEPTAALTHVEVEKLHASVRRLRSEGVAIVYVSHFLDEVVDLSDVVTVMRNGRVVETIPSGEASVDRLIVGMLGGKLEAVYPAKAPAPGDAPVALRASGLEVREGRPIDLEIRQGEILGLFGLMGAGRSSLGHVLAGSRRRVAGVVEAAGEPVDFSTPRQAIDSGVVLLPESRRDQGLFLSLSQLANSSVGTLDEHARMGVIQTRRQRSVVNEMLTRLNVDPIRLGAEVERLSGGNQQKILFAKCLLGKPSVLILDEPTRGVDIGAKQSIYHLIAELAAEGVAVVLISSELEEVANLAHRVAVMREGRVVEQFEGNDIDHAAVLSAAFGISERDSAGGVQVNDRRVQT
ncbi:MAG: ribose transport system ATP-binding protein [Thermoleophilaceae bacterium]|nr:ribose transport system ATP-binding protein [Thermoleophilaceae bacterium]